MKALNCLIFSILSLIAFGQNAPLELRIDERAVFENVTDTSHLIMKSLENISLLDLQGFNISSVRFLQSGESKAEMRWTGQNLDFYSMPPVSFPQLRTPTIRMTPERMMGIRKGLLSPTEILDVGGRIKVGFKEGTATEGVIRFNPDEKQFEGFNGINWKNFGSLSVDDDGDSGIRIKEDLVDSIVFKVNGNETMHFGGHVLEFGKDGNTFIGNGVTPFDVPQNIGNTVTGWLSARSMNSGVSNSIYGFSSSEELVSGDFNTIVGSQSANKLSTGSRNTLLGYRAGWNSGGAISGNVFIGYRAGEGFVGNDRLVISNSETTTPLIDGDFSNQTLDVNGQMRIKGNAIIENNTTISGQVSIDGTTTIGNQLTTNDIKINDDDPFLEFQQLGNSQFYFQYESSTDEFILVESGEGIILKAKGGDLYLPKLAQANSAELRINSDGKVIAEKDITNPISFLGSLLQPALGRNRVNMELYGLKKGLVVHTFEVRKISDGGEVQDVFLSRYHKFNNDSGVVFKLNVGYNEGVYSTSVIETPGSNILDPENYFYYISTGEEGAILYRQIHLYH